MKARGILPLPHAYPLVLLDRIVAVQPGHSAEARKQLSRDDPLFDGDGHLPPCLLAEMLAQCAGAALEIEAGAICVLAKVDRFRSRRRVTGGRELQLRVKVVRALGATVKVRGSVRSAGRILAAGELVLQVQNAGAIE